MNLKLHCGDIARVPAEVLVASANPWLRLTGGVGAALEAVAGESVRVELEDYLRATGQAMVPPGSVIATGPAGDFASVLHAVAIDGRYRSSPKLLRETLRRVLAQARGRSIVLPALATGYGNLPMIDFLLALRDVLPEAKGEVTLVLSRQEFVDQAGIVLGTHSPAPGPEPAVAPGWRLLLMAEVLHSWGYERLRIYPHLSDSGVWWRCYFTPASNMKPDGSGLLTSAMSPLTARYSSSEKDSFFGWAEAGNDPAVHLATRLLASFPAIAEGARGSDPAYVRWYREQVLRRCSADNLPFVAYDSHYEYLGYLNRNQDQLTLPPAPQSSSPSGSGSNSTRS